MTSRSDVTRAEDPRRGVLMLLTGSVIISFSAVFVRLVDVGPTATGVYRNLFGAIALLVVIAVRREVLWRGRVPFLWALLAGVFFAVDIWCWHRSILYIGPGLATIMGNFQVFALAAAGILLFGERATWRFFMAIPMALLGLLLLVGAEWRSPGGSYPIGVLFGLLTAASYAGYLLILRYSQRSVVRLPGTSNLAVITLSTAIMLFVVAVAEGADMRIPDAASWTWLLCYGILCQAVGWIIISSALRVVDASRAGLLLLTQPTLTFVWDVLFFDRRTSGVEVTGAVVALMAIYLGNTRKRS